MSKAGIGWGAWKLVLLDINFEYYLTPWIIKVLWGLVAGWSVLSVILAGIWVFKPEPDPDVVRFERRRLEAFQWDQQQPPEPQPNEPWIDPATFAGVLSVFTKAIAWVALVLITVMWLLFIRVICEIVIVVFNIAKSLEAIEEKTTPAH